MDVMWRFCWKSEDVPIIGCCAESMDEEALLIMWVKSLWLIEKAREYGGIPYADNPTTGKHKYVVSVSFSTLFPTFECANRYLMFLEKLEHI